MSSKSDFQKTINAIKSGKSSTQSTKTASSSGIEKEKAAFADLTSNLKNKVSSNPTFRSDALKTEMDAVYRKREEASKKRQNYTGRGSWLMYSDPVIAHAMNLQASEDADAEFQRYDAEYNRLRTELYNIENQTSVNSIRGNADVAEQYTDAKTAREDMKKLFHSYLPTTGLNADQVTFGYQNHDAQLQQIQNREELWKKYGAYEPIGVAARISAAERQSVSNLEDAGYNFDRISDYEQRLIDAENRKKERKENLQLAYNNPVVASAIRIGAAPFQGLDYLSVARQTIANDLRGEEDWRPVNTDKLQLTHFVTDVQGEIGQNIEENTDWKIGNQNVARFLYDTGMSMSDSLVSIIATGGVGTSVLLGGAAASQTALQTLENGGTEEQAVLTGLTAGAAEYIFEKVGIDNLLSHKNVRNMKHFVTETLKQGGIEATEEVLTEISNIFTNAIIMGQNSDFNKTVEFYMSIEGGNLSEEDAKKQAILNCISQVAWAGAGGFLSGGVMGGAYNGANLYNSIKEASDAYGDNPSALIKETLENNPDDQYAMELQKRLSEKKNVSGYQLSKLAAKNEENIVNNDVDAIQTAVADRLTELGETGDISEIASAIAKKVANRKLTGAERKALSESRYGIRVSNEIDPENIRSGKYTSEWTKNIGTKRINPVTYGQRTIQPKQTVTASEVIEKASAPKQTETSASKEVAKAEEAQKVKVAKSVSKTGKTELTTGDEVEVEAISSVGNGKMTVRLTDGRIVTSDSVLHASDDDARLYQTVAELASTPGNADVMIQGFKKSGMSNVDYNRGLRMAHMYGKNGVPIHQLRESESASKLSEDVRMAAYKSGQKTGGLEVAKELAVVKGGKKTAIKTGVQFRDDDGKTHNFREYLKSSKKTLNERQEAGLVAAEMLNEAYGISFRFFESYTDWRGDILWINEKGVEDKAPNGMYCKGGVIYVDLNAGVSRDSLVLFTEGHELTHFINEWSPAKFKILANAVLNQLSEQGQNVELLITNKIAKSRNELSREVAIEEVVADAMEGILADGKVMQSVMNDIKAQDQSLWDKIVSWLKDAIDKLKNLVKAYDGAKPDSVEGRAIADMKDAIGTLEQLYADALKDAGESFKSASTEVNTDVVAVEETTHYSYRSLAEAAGFEAVEYEDGTRAYTRNGEKVSEVTVDDIENSPIGALINFSLDMNDITAEEAEAQKKLFADICTLACKSKDFAMTMQFVGSAVFTGIKANADKQYGTTYDFPSICTKTQAVIDAMSAKMVALERGLTTEEIKELYNEVHHMGNPVPCPECYVFSRWVGIGGLLDNIKHYQDVYGDMNPEEVAARYRDMHVEVEASAIELGISFGKAKGALANKYTKEFNKLKEKVEKQQNQGENVTREDLDKLADLESMMDTVKAMTWIEKVYFADSAMKKVNPGFRVPSEVLFDLGNGEAFASVYKEAWAFRTTQGAGYGKAITPYAEARLGEGILGTNSITNTVKKKATGELNNPYLKQKGKLDKDTRKKLIDARAKQKNQAFIGGQRFQSTSDARFENASDYLLATLEMQAMHGMVQDYTKVDGAVPAFSAWGFSTNQSLMPKDGGLDANGNITDSTVGGMLPRIAFENRKKFESAGTITIGVNDAHIRKMFADENRDFVIPYHASGGKADTIAEFRAIQEGEDVKTKKHIRSTDYSKTQSDKVLSDEVLRWIGKTDAEIKHIHDVRAARIAILTRTKPNMSVVRGNRFLSALYDKLNGGEWDGVKLAKGKVESQIFPNEFWDQSVTYEESGKITRDYLEYCEDLGFLHRFSGKVPKNGMLISVKGYDQFGNRVTLTDLAYKVDENGNQTDEVEDFFWKVLTDRRMYDNSGNYLPQKVVSLNTTTKDTVTNFAKFNHGRQYNKELSKQFTDKIKADADVLKMSNRDAELADNFVNHMKGILNTRRSWYAKDVINYVQEHPELNFIDRIYVKDKAVKTDLKKFLDNIDNLETLDYLSWYMGQAYSNPNTRGAVRTFRNAIKKRMNDIKTAQVGGTNLGIKNGEVTLSEIRELYHKLNTNEDMVEFADKVFDTVERLGINIRFVNQTFAKNVSGNVMGDMLEYKTSYFNDTAVADQRKAQTILHEMLHVCTSYVLFANTTMGDVSSNQYSDNWDRISNAATRLNRIYNQIQYDPEFRGQYGITNVHEMVAELANPEFVGLMKKKSLWESIVDWICELFGYTRGDSAYDNAKMCVDYILDNPEVKAYKDYANDIRSRARWQYDTFGETKYSDRDVEKISPIEIAPINGIEDRAKFDYLVSEFKHNGWNGRPIVVVENGNNGYIALTGSHRILAASEADIDVEAIVLDYTEELDELINAYTDDERASIAEELRDEGLLSDDVYRLIAREEDLNWENSGVPYDQQIRYSDRVLMGSLFSGGGTLEAGLVYQMVDKQFAVEYNEKIASVYTDNHGKEHMFVGDVRDFDSKKKDNVFYLHASPVCKNFSAAKKNGGETTLDIVTAEATARVLEEQMPQVFTVENVKRYRGSEAYKLITNKLDELGYSWDVDVYNSAHYGAATARERLIIRAVKDGALPAKPKKTGFTTWYDAVADLIDELPEAPMPNWMRERYDAGNYRTDMPLFILGGNKSTGLSTAYADKPAPTLLASSHDARIVMPDGRVLKATPRAMARIQGLPDDYKLPKQTTRAYTVIGNGIPTQLTKAVMGGVLDHAYEQTHGKVLYSDRTSNTELAEADDVALYIKNTDKADYINMIFNGAKTEETRSRRTLDAFIGKDFYVTDGKYVYGSIVLGEPHKYTDAEFHQKKNQLKHRVPVGDKYDIKPGGIKWAYPIESYKKFDAPKKMSDSTEYKNSFQARQVLYSDRDTAPVFYSHMAKVIDGVKQEKLGAASVVSMLRGKGVKAEEIKWSGIEDFLAGKKSVTKQELQEFAAGSMLEIEEQTLDDKKLPYSEEEQAQIAKLETERDSIVEELKSEWQNLIGSDIPIDYFGEAVESKIANQLFVKESEMKRNSETGKRYEASSKELRRVIKESDDDFGYYNSSQAFWAVDKDPEWFLTFEDLKPSEKSAIEKYARARKAYNNLEGIPLDVKRKLLSIGERIDRVNKKIDWVKDDHYAKQNERHTKWSQYKLDGGKNYRELLLKLPNSVYTNKAMRIHWDATKGVLVHARVQDFDTADGRMLFVEEVQSDWHNEGQKAGYWKEYSESDYELRRESGQLRLFAKGERTHFSRNEKSNAHRSQEDILSELVRQFEYEVKRDNSIKAPHAPFSDTYHEFVMKRLLREAAEKGYDSIGWTTAQTQDERWADNFIHEEGKGKSGFLKAYTNEYDKKIPSFMRKFGKKFGASVGKTYVSSEQDAAQRIAELESDIAYYQSHIDKIREMAGEFFDETDAEDIQFYEEGIEDMRASIERLRGTEVWSMPITDSMRESVLYEGQPMYSERDPLTDQEVLKRAAEGLAIDDLTDAERDALKLFKKRMNRLEGLQAQRKKLGEEYRRAKKDDKPKVKEMMTQTDRQIDKARDDVLKVEQAEVLRRVLHDARKLVEAEERKRVYAREKEKFDKREAKIRKEYADRREAVRENTKERKLKAELRKKIRKTVRELDKLLTKGTKERNVKEDLKELVASTLKSAEILFTDELTDDDLLRNGIETQMTDKEKEHLAEALKLFNKLQSFYKDPSVYNNLEDVKKDENRLAYRKSQLKDVFVRERSRLNEAKVSDVLNELADAYAKLQESDVSYINDSYNEVVHQYILWTKQQIGGTLIKDMNSDQLADLNKIYTMVKTIVRDANKMFAKNLKETKEQMANRAMFEVRQAGGEHGMWTKAGAALSTFGWNNLKPIYAVERLGSNTLVRLFKNIRKGEDVWKVNIDEADAFRRAIQKKYNFDSWNNDKQFKFTAASGIEFSLSLEQMMSLYAYSKREQAHAHLLKGGFVFDKNTEVVVNKNGIKVTYLNKNAKAHSLDFDILSKIISKLTAEQIAYVDEMQEYLSTTMGNKGNEVSMQLYGVKMFGEKYYFPLRSAGQYMARAKETDLKKEQGQVNLINSAFTKMTVYNASNPVVLSNFSDVWNDHVNEMSMYNAFVLPLEDFRKIWNYSTPNMEGGESVSVNSVIQNAYGDAAVAYFDQLIKDLNGGALSDNRENIAKRLTGLFKKSAVFASLSVVIQQPMSVVRAFAEIDPKYFVGDKMNASRHKETWAELKKYAPVAGIKEMGYFDTGMGMSARDFLSAKEYKDIKEKAKALVTDSNYRDELLGKAPALADEIAWCLIWSAVKRETKANNPKMSIKSEEFLQMCGDRFTDIVTRTQVYDSVLARSANMRSKSALMTMATSFGAEPTTVANMVDSAVQKLKKGDKQGATRQLASVLGSIILTGAAVSLVYAMRDDDEDETFLEKYMQSFAVEVVDGMNPMTYLPFVRDVWSILQGYDVERADMSLIADVVSSMQNIVKLMSKDTSNMSEEALAGHKKQLFEAYWGAADYLFAMFGLPVKNIRRDIKGAFNVVKVIGEDLSGRDTTWGSLVDKTWDSVKRSLPVIGWTPAETTQDKLYKAIVSGDKVYADRLKGTYKNQSAVDSAIRKALRTNDPRIKEAAIAWNSGKHSEYMKIAKSIIAEKNVSQDNIVKAIMAEADALAPDESTITNKVTHVGLFNMDGFSSAIAQGNTAMADTMKTDIIDTAIKNGKTRDEAESNFATSVRSEVKELYLADEIKEPRAYEVLTSYGKMTKQDAENTLRAYNWMKNNPRYDLTVSQALSYTKAVDNVGESPEDSGISPDVFVEYLNLQSKCKGFDNDSDGKADRNSKKNQILEVIDNLPITSYQKDVLYFMNGWARSNLRKAPWH